MVKVKFFQDNRNEFAEDQANKFLSRLDDNQVIDVKYSVREDEDNGNTNYVTMLVVYKES